jgi:hypothetical protein
MRCYCSFCRKTSGSGGYGINIMAQADKLEIKGEENLRFHHGMEHEEKADKLITNQNRRYFCQHCGSPLWAADPRWPDWIYPFAGSIDTELPTPPETVHIMLDFAAPWVEIPVGPTHKQFRRYPEESIEQWHKRHGLFENVSA